MAEFNGINQPTILEGLCHLSISAITKSTPSPKRRPPKGKNESQWWSSRINSSSRAARRSFFWKAWHRPGARGFGWPSSRQGKHSRKRHGLSVSKSGRWKWWGVPEQLMKILVVHDHVVATGHFVGSECHHIGNHILNWSYGHMLLAAAGGISLIFVWHRIDMGPTSPKTWQQSPQSKLYTFYIWNFLSAPVLTLPVCNTQTHVLHMDIHGPKTRGTVGLSRHVNTFDMLIMLGYWIAISAMLVGHKSWTILWFWLCILRICVHIPQTASLAPSVPNQRGPHHRLSWFRIYLSHSFSWR